VGLGFTCAVCGLHHEDQLLDVRADRPELWLTVPEDELEARTWDAGDFCTVDDDGGRTHRYVRALIEIPVPELEHRFAYGVWVEVETDSFNDVLRRYYAPDVLAGDAQPSYEGWLATRLAGYPRPTVGLPGSITLRAGTLAPAFVLDDVGHVLSDEQREGISVHRVEELTAPYVGR
jgi:hypothetical protein